MEYNLENWPSVDGRYEVGNKTSSVAVCTNASIDEIKINHQKVAIWGKCVTENIGIEKIIQNVVSNPNIRYLVLCGKESRGHFVSQVIESLVKNGVDENKKIIGAKGNMPYLRGISQELIERFRNQIIPINIIGETDSRKIDQIIDKLLKTNPGNFSAKMIEIDKVDEIKAQPCLEWIADPKGFFVISINRNPAKIIVEHFQNNQLKKKIVGDSAEDICKTIGKLDLIGDFQQTKEHAMYLGRELQKAEIALKHRLDYEQDVELKIKKSKQEKKDLTSANQDDWFD